jgi:hypothetical protein
MLPVLLSASAITPVNKALPLDQSKNFLTNPQEAGMLVELIAVPGAPHGIKTRKTYMPDYEDRVMVWLKKSLGPYEVKSSI